MKITLFALVCAVLGALLGVATARVQLGEATVFTSSDSGVAPSSLSDRPMPRVSVDSETFDFGHMERHASQSHDFLFTNVGKAPLQLTVGETTCKCTVGKAPSGMVEPGETVPVTLNWTAETGESEFRQNATIHTNDPLRQTVRLTVVGKVTDASSYHPRTLHFGNVPSGSTRSADLKIVSFQTDDLEILGTELVQPASDEHFTIEIEELPAEEYPTPDVLAGRRVRVTTQPTLPYGRIEGWLKVRTNLPTLPEIDVPLGGHVVSDISIFGRGYSAERDQLDLGAVNGERGHERQLYLLLHGENAQDIEFHVQETFPQFLEVEFGERKQVKEDVLQMPLVIRVPPESPPAVHVGGQDSKTGRVVIETTHPRVPEVVIHVKLTVQ